MNEETKSKLEQEINDGFHKLIEEHPDIFPKPGPGYIAFKKELASWFKDHPAPDVAKATQGE